MSDKEIKPHGNSKYKDTFPDLVIEFGKRGLSREAIAAKLNISKETLYQWINPKSNCFVSKFADALQASKAYSLLHYQELINSKLINQDGNLNNAAIGLLMRNIHNWDSKQTIEHTGADGKELTFNFNLMPLPDILINPTKQITNEEDDDE